MRWHHTKNRQLLEAIAIDVALLREAHRRHDQAHVYRSAEADPGPPHPHLVNALAVATRDGYLLPLEVQDRHFLAALGPSGGDPEEIWEAAAGLALTDGAPGVPCEGATQVAFPVYRAFPQGLLVVAAPGGEGVLQVWQNAAAPAGELRAAMRRIRSTGRGGRHTGHTALVLGALTLAAGTVAGVASLHAGHGPRPANIAPAAPPIAASAPDWRRNHIHHRDGILAARHRDRSNPAGAGHPLRTNPAPSPSSSASVPPGSPVPSPSIAVTLGKVPLVHIKHDCARVLFVKVCPQKR